MNAFRYTFVGLLQGSLLMTVAEGREIARAQIPTSPPGSPMSEADRLRGTYGPFRANNNLLYYHLDVRVDPEHQTRSGKNMIRFKMLEPGTRIQLDLVTALNIDKI